MEEVYILPPATCGDIYAFEDLIAASRGWQTRRNLVIDFSQVAFIEPYSLVALLLISRKYLRDTGSKLVFKNLSIAVLQYLARMDFFKNGIVELDGTLRKVDELKRSAFSKRVIEIIEIPNKERDSVKVINSVIALFRKRANCILQYWVGSNTVDYFVTVISELCQNVFEHAFDSGFCALQTYNYGKGHVLRLVIADSGIGIKESFVGRNIPPYETEADLLALALMTPISSKRNFGYGLCQVNSVMEKMKGQIYLRSGTASISVLYRQKSGGRAYVFKRNNLAEFSGTQISLTLMTDKI